MRWVTRGPDGYLTEEFGEREEEVRAAVADYMSESPIVLSSPSTRIPRGNDRERGVIFRSDGAWLWTQAGAEALRDGTIDVESDFVSHIMKTKTPPQRLSEDQLAEVRDTILSRAG